MIAPLYTDGAPFGLRLTSTSRSLVLARGGLTGTEVARAELLPVLVAMAREMTSADRKALLLNVAGMETVPALAPVASSCCSGCGSTGPCNAGCENRTWWEVAR